MENISIEPFPFLKYEFNEVHFVKGKKKWKTNEKFRWIFEKKEE